MAGSDMTEPPQQMDSPAARKPVDKAGMEQGKTKTETNTTDLATQADEKEATTSANEDAINPTATRSNGITATVEQPRSYTLPRHTAVTARTAPALPSVWKQCPPQYSDEDKAAAETLMQMRYPIVPRPSISPLTPPPAQPNQRKMAEFPFLGPVPDESNEIGTHDQEKEKSSQRQGN